VDQARLVDLVFHAHVKRLVDGSPDADSAVRLADAEHGGWLAIHLDAASLQLKHCPRRLAVA
jgi:hypothetical protein